MRIPQLRWVERLKTERRQYFDEEIAPELWDLLEATALLEVKEFTLFELAYKDWHGTQPTRHVIEGHFRNYMFNQVIPAWVRSYSRKVIDLDQSGKLDPQKLGVYQPLPNRHLVLVGKLYGVFLFGMLLLMIYVAYNDTEVIQSLFGRADVEIMRTHHTAMP